MHVSLPAPAHWQDFELLCRDLFAAQWNDPDAKRHGRSSQDQAGVDVYGKRAGAWCGVQCKLRDQHYGARVTVAELKEEVKRAKAFKPGLATFILATTAPTDAKVQEAARKLTDEGPFRVEVCFWEDLVALLQQHQHQSVLHRHYAWDRPDKAEERELRNYLQSVKDKLGVIPLAAIHQHSDRSPTLDAVYTALDVEQSLRATKYVEPPEPYGMATGGVVLLMRLARSRLEANPYLRARSESVATSVDGGVRGDDASVIASLIGRRLRAIEFLAAHQYAVLLGPPGSGKSAFASFVAVCLANQRLGHTSRGLAHLAGITEASDSSGLRADDVWPHGALIPLYIELRAFVNDPDAFPKPMETLNASHLLTHLQSPRAKVPIPASCMPYLRDALLGPSPQDRPDIGQGRGVLLLLDGLDETPSEQRQQLKAAILAFADANPNARVLVTSRPYAYRTDGAWRLPNFADETLAPLDSAAIERFVRGWYVSLAGSGTLGTHDAGSRPEELLDRIRHDRHLRPLAERPLLLTLLTTLHASAKLGDGGRAAVYAASVDLLFDRWNEVRGGQRIDHFHALVGLEKSVMLDVLRRLAWRVHGARSRHDAGTSADISFAMVWEELTLARTRARIDQGKVDERQALEYLDQRAGLLLAEGGMVFRFPHRSYQEYLAAEHFCKDHDFPAQLTKAVRQDSGLWREVLGYCVLMHAQRSPSQVWSLVEELVRDGPAASGQPPPTDGEWRTVLTLASAMAESDSLRVAVREAPVSEPEGRVARCVGRLRSWLLQAVESHVLRASDRIEAGEALGLLGDSRIGHRGENFLPIAPGSKVALGKYLVTVQEYGEFVEARGYERDEYWEPDGGLALRKERGWTEPANFAQQREHPNRPVVGVSWYEAWAYCRWRSESSKGEVRLPTAKERDLAACPDERGWPWGNDPEPSPEIANFNGNIGRPTPVGCYPQGVGKHGHLDLGGNVWEWVMDEGRRAGEDRWLAIRGGSWLRGADDLRARGDGAGAIGRNDVLGFRVVAFASR